jgi:predicted transposase YdaD
MADEDPYHAHDRLFRVGLSNPAAVAPFLMDRLPAEIVARIDWSTLRLEPGSYVDPDLRMLETDLLFTAKADGRDVGIYVLFEHQSTRDPRLPMRLLRYMVNIWHDWERVPGNRPPYPHILSTVVAQNGSVWNVDPRLSSLFEFTGPEDPMRRYLPDFFYELIQLAAIPYASIRSTPEGMLVLRILKAERAGELLSDHIWDPELIGRVVLETFRRALRYLASRESIDTRAFLHKIHRIVSEPHRTEAMTLAQQLRNEGRQEGRNEGRQEGRQEGRNEGRQEGRQEGEREGAVATGRQAVLEALEIRFGPVPEGLRESIAEIDDPERLRVLHRKAIVSASMEVFAAAL